jgi:hypothetical protein
VDPRVAGGAFSLRFLRIRGEQELTEEEQLLVRKVVHQSWNLLRVVGEPDLGDLEAICRELIEVQKGPFSAERSRRPRPT